MGDLDGFLGWMAWTSFLGLGRVAWTDFFGGFPGDLDGFPARVT